MWMQRSSKDATVRRELETLLCELKAVRNRANVVLAILLEDAHLGAIAFHAKPTSHRLLETIASAFAEILHGRLVVEVGGRFAKRNLDVGDIEGRRRLTQLQKYGSRLRVCVAKRAAPSRFHAKGGAISVC